jgi:hypothetical protein
VCGSFAATQIQADIFTSRCLERQRSWTVSCCLDPMVLSAFRRTAVILLSILLLAAASVQAGEPIGDPHVRLLFPCDKSLIDDASQNSETVRGLMDRLTQSDLVVYVRCTTFKSSALAGRLMFMGAVAGVRYVVVDVRIQTQWRNHVATLAHELMHAVEVAEAPWVQNNADMERFYREVGMMTNDRPRSFETAAARSVGSRVYRELFTTWPASKTADTAHAQRE